MSQETVPISFADFNKATTDASAAVASGWSEAAGRFGEWIAAESAHRVITETEKFERLATELGTGLRAANANAATWAQAARNAGNTGIAKVMDKYAAKFAAQADTLLGGMLDGKSRLNLIAAEVRTGMSAADGVLGGGFGKAVGPAFDAFAMLDGALEWVHTGSSDKFGSASMGVLFSAALGLLGAGVATFVGAPVIGMLVAAAIGATIGSALGGPLYELFRDSVPAVVNSLFGSARNWTPPRDPLVLDLDNDGIEAVGINPNAPILFDHDGDGTKNATGWIKADDGIVVFDRNGNGLIDSGKELFGDNTVLTRGPKAGQTAANGFEAIADLDVNGDGALNSGDAAYTQLRIWQDANQDGISQAAELKTLAQAGIASINVTGTASNINLGNGNTQPFSGSFTRANGTTGASGVAEVTGSLLLASNNFYREFTDDPTVTAAAAALPQMHGSGWVNAWSVATFSPVEM